MSEKRLRRWEDLTWLEIDADRENLIAVLPGGSIEQHGPHLPLGTDTYIPVGLLDLLWEYVSDELWRRMVMLPPLHYTYAKHSSRWPGTISLDGATLSCHLADLSVQLGRSGVNRLLLINGHMESVSFLEEGLEMALDRGTTVRALLVNWWDCVSDATLEEIFADKWPGWEREHAGLTETSLMLALYPHLVNTYALQHIGDIAPVDEPFVVLPRGPAKPHLGVYAPPDLAGADLGMRLAADILRGIAGAVQKYLA